MILDDLLCAGCIYLYARRRRDRVPVRSRWGEVYRCDRRVLLDKHGVLEGPPLARLRARRRARSGGLLDYDGRVLHRAERPIVGVGKENWDATCARSPRLR